MPGQGLFIGEPLANPFGGHQVHFDGRDLSIRAGGLRPGAYEVTGANEPAGPYVAVASNLQLAKRGTTVRIRDAAYRYYRISLQR